MLSWQQKSYSKLLISSLECDVNFSKIKMSSNLLKYLMQAYIFN